MENISSYCSSTPCGMFYLLKTFIIFAELYFWDETYKMNAPDFCTCAPCLFSKVQHINILQRVIFFEETILFLEL
jgi:hypothetical protein